MTDSDNITWTCTDPDNHQYGRKVKDGVYEFKEWIGGGKLDESIEETIKQEFDNPGCWEQDTISLSDYTEEQIESHVTSYYDSLTHLKEIYGDSWEWITAECIFEMESCLY
jgi:hypothetical protein